MPERARKTSVNKKRNLFHLDLVSNVWSVIVSPRNVCDWPGFPGMSCVSWLPWWLPLALMAHRLRYVNREIINTTKFGMRIRMMLIAVAWSSACGVSQLDWIPIWNGSKLELDWNRIGRTPKVLVYSNWNSWKIGIQFGLDWIPINEIFNWNSNSRSENPNSFLEFRVQLKIPFIGIQSRPYWIPIF